jgi:hypothetical protein
MLAFEIQTQATMPIGWFQESALRRKSKIGRLSRRQIVRELCARMAPRGRQRAWKQHETRDDNLYASPHRCLARQLGQ